MWVPCPWHRSRQANQGTENHQIVYKGAEEIPVEELDQLQQVVSIVDELLDFFRLLAIVPTYVALLMPH